MIARLRFRLLLRGLRLRRAVRGHPILGEVYELVDGTIGDYVRDHGLIYSAALAFYTLLSLIPLLILFASAAGFLLHYMGRSGELEELTQQVMVQLKSAIPFLDARFEQDIEHIIENRRSLGLVGLLTLLLSSSQMFRALEFAFARIFSEAIAESGSRAMPRQWLQSKLIFGGFVFSLVGVFIVFRFVLVLLQRVTQALPDAISGLFEDPLGGESLAAHGISGVIVVVGFAVMVKASTRHRVELRYTAIGGVVFYLVWQSSRVLFSFYLTYRGDLGAIYGSFSALISGVLWVFVSSALFLMCGELVKTLQRRFTHGRRYPVRRPTAE